jgi:elongation factor 3
MENKDEAQYLDLIKNILIGELKTTHGEVTKHPDMRLAYIAQHAFHRLENMFKRTFVVYKWKY